MYDIAIIGGGPAGLSAALTARQRNKTVAIFEPRGFSPRLSKAHKIENYLGMPSLGGKELMDAFVSHVKAHKPDIIEEKAINIFPGEDDFTILTGGNTYQAGSVIIATGAPSGQQYHGESEFLGRGVSYCATCDGMFFKDKKVAVVAALPESEEETLFLTEICREVLYFPLYKGDYPQHERLKIINAQPKAILGEGSVSALETQDGRFEVDGIFIFRDSEPLENILPSLELEEKAIKVDAGMGSNIPGVFAAGDCTGRPWQISRATGQGVTAALAAVAFLAKKATV